MTEHLKVVGLDGRMTPDGVKNSRKNIAVVVEISYGCCWGKAGIS